MKASACIAAIPLLALASCPTGHIPQLMPTTAGSVLAFVDASVTDVGRGTLLRGQTVVVRDGRIESVSAEGASAGATVISAKGKFIALASLTASLGVWNCPTLAIIHIYANNVERTGRAVENRRRMVARSIARAHMAGTDSGIGVTQPGTSLHDEVAELVASGLTAAEALRTATSTAAEFLGTVGEIGVVAPGARADLSALRTLADARAPRQAVRAPVKLGHSTDAHFK